MKLAILLFIGVPPFLISDNYWGKVGKVAAKTRFNQHLEENPEKKTHKWSCSGRPGAAGHMLPGNTKVSLFLPHTLQLIVHHNQQCLSAVLAATFSCLSSLVGNKYKVKIHKPLKDKIEREKNMF